MTMSKRRSLMSSKPKITRARNAPTKSDAKAYGSRECWRKR